MLGRSLLGAGVPRRAAHFVTASLAVAGFGALGGCLSRPIETVVPHTTSTVVERLPAGAVDKIDLVLVVDNSASMADKQQILSLAIPDLLTGLVNPRCVDGNGVPTATQPGGPLESCPANSDREFPPVVDIHIGVLSSSLGSMGTQGCPTASAPISWGNPTMDDAGHLISRSDAASPTTNLVKTYQGMGFLAWDPKQQLNPPGEASLANLEDLLGKIVVGDGQMGCGWESQNESWYRFLVDPEPPTGISWDDSNRQVTISGPPDAALLKQRAAFLRPDSLLAIINVTDETDTSVKAESFYPIITSGEDLPRPRSECATKGPNDPCCASCGAKPQPQGCPADPTCSGALVDDKQLRAFGLISHKARYGVEFFYPPSRYVQALTSRTVVGRDGKTVPNPIFSVLDPSLEGAAVRDQSLVFYAAITGVPWQLIARQKNGVPDLASGFKSASELAASDGKGSTFWDDIAGDPEHYVAAGSPFMVESIGPRSGVDPITGIAVSPSAPSDNDLNGRERPLVAGQGDIQYACIFPILKPIDCSSSGAACDCHASESPDKNPLCGPNPADIDPVTHAPRYTLQVKAKAYPGIKNLAIARGMGDQGIAASLCAKSLDPMGPPLEYGYRPAMNAIINRLKVAIGNPCLPTQLKANPATHQVACVVLDARDTGGAPCTCDGAGRKDVASGQQAAVVQAHGLEPSTASYCFCEVTPTEGAALASCQNDKVATNADGWCYVDETTGNASLVAGCPASERREIRFVGAGKQQPGSIRFISCEQD